MNILTMTYLCITCNREKATFAAVESKEPQCCFGCKRPDMVRRSEPQTTCKIPGCISQRSFGFPGQKMMTCFVHKALGMVNLKYKRCSQIRCKLTPCYENSTGQKFCFHHSNKDMKELNLNLATHQMKYF